MKSNFPIFLRILGVLSTFSFYPIYRFQREERRLEFNSGPLNFCHCERKQALTVSKAISIAIDSNTSTRSYFCLYVVESSPLWAISFEKIGDRGLLARIVFARFPIGEQIFFPPLLAQFNFHIIDCTRCKYIYTFFDLIIFYGEKPFCEEYNRYNKMFIFCNLFLLSVKFPLRKFSIYIYIYYNR